MVIGLLGYTDKRPILYPLMKLLSETGDVLIITQNRHLKRLSDGYSSLGYIANILVAVTDLTPDEIWDEMDINNEDFDHIIYDIQETLPADVDYYIHVKGSDFEEDEEDFLECIEEYKKIKLMYDGKYDNDKKYTNIPITLNMIAKIEILENKKLLLPMPSKKINKLLGNMLAPEIGIPVRDTMRLLTKRWEI